ncbi:hypothetical protein EGW08_003736, partial [Elysia chlorotica]
LIETKKKSSIVYSLCWVIITGRAMARICTKHTRAKSNISPLDLINGLKCPFSPDFFNRVSNKDISTLPDSFIVHLALHYITSLVFLYSIYPEVCLQSLFSQAVIVGVSDWITVTLRG